MTGPAPEHDHSWLHWSHWRNRAAPYERHLSALAMIAGFAFDNYVFRRVDVAAAQLLFALYLLGAALAIVALHRVEARGKPDGFLPWRILLPMAAQFAFGSLWSGLLIFYTRSAVIAASWPFLLVLVAVFIGNEYFKHYHSRRIFSSVLLFFALFACAIFVVPVYVHAIGAWVFLLSGAVAVALYAGFLKLLAMAGRDHFMCLRREIALGAAGVFAAMNIFYFTGILPPLPLALRDAGVYQSIRKQGDVYLTQGETQPWTAWFGLPQQVHVGRGSPVYVYSSVFAPVALAATIVHRWEWRSPKTGRWVPMGAVSFAMAGGRDGGYRGFSGKANPLPGEWRVSIETPDGRVIGRVRFSLIASAQPPVLTAGTLQ